MIRLTNSIEATGRNKGRLFSYEKRGDDPLLPLFQSAREIISSGRLLLLFLFWVKNNSSNKIEQILFDSEELRRVLIIITNAATSLRAK